jgi:hypothetical protein
LEAGTVDIDLRGINIDSARLQKVQFSVSTYESSIFLVTTEERDSLTWLVLEPFSWQLWTVLVVAGLVMAHALWLLEGMEKTYPRGIIDVVWLAFANRCSVVGSASLFLTSDRSVFLPFYCLGSLLAV